MSWIILSVLAYLGFSLNYEKDGIGLTVSERKWYKTEPHGTEVADAGSVDH